MLSAAKKVTEDLLLGVAASPTLSEDAVPPLADQVASVPVPTIGSACPTPEHHPEEQKMATPRTKISQDSNAEEAGANIKPRKIRKMLLIIIFPPLFTESPLMQIII